MWNRLPHSNGREGFRRSWPLTKWEDHFSNFSFWFSRPNVFFWDCSSTYERAIFTKPNWEKIRVQLHHWLSYQNNYHSLTTDLHLDSSVIPFIYGRLIVSIDLPETLSLEIRLAGAGQYPTQQYETKLLDDPSLSYWLDWNRQKIWVWPWRQAQPAAEALEPTA